MFNNGVDIMCKEDYWIPQCFPHPPKTKVNHDPSIVWAGQLVLMMGSCCNSFSSCSRKSGRHEMNLSSGIA